MIIAGVKCFTTETKVSIVKFNECIMHSKEIYESCKLL